MKRLDMAGLQAPAVVVDLELNAGLPESVSGDSLDVERLGTLWCLARRDGIPLGVTVWEVASDDALTRSDLRDHVTEATAASEGRFDLPPETPAPSVTVAICTRDRPVDIARALDSLGRQSDPDFSVVVVDNAPRDDATHNAVAASSLDRCQYVVAPSPGLSRARNVAMDHVSSDVIAWMDDDERADADWVRRVKQGFNHSSNPAAVCGLMLPAELRTEAQVRFEQYGGFNKGRGFAPEVLSVSAGTVRSPLYPLPIFGSGGNMAFRVGALREAGGFDPALGAGTRTHGGDETKTLATVLRRGGTILHWPAAVQWHYHRTDMAALRAQLTGYGAGLSAFVTSMFADEPMKTARGLAGLIPTAVRDSRSGSTHDRTGGLPPDFPADLARAPRQGFVRGAADYVLERLAQRPGAGRH
jgi:GT2 family glycosyltransferase